MCVGLCGKLISCTDQLEHRLRNESESRHADPNLPNAENLQVTSSDLMSMMCTAIMGAEQNSVDIAFPLA